MRAGLDDLHAWQSSFGSLDLQTNVVGHGVRLAVRGLALAVQSRSDAVLFEWSERARMLASRIQPVRAPQDPQTAADLAELRAGPAPEREAELRRRIRERAWQHKGSGEVADPVALADLQAGLGEDTALVAYVVTAERVVALVVTSAGTRPPRPRARGRGSTTRWAGCCRTSTWLRRSCPTRWPGRCAARWRAGSTPSPTLLVDPLLDDLGERRLVLTPSGLLAGVPWTLLPGLVGRPVTVAQSATSWLARSATPLRTGSAGFVAGPRVVRAEAEVRAAAKAWRAAPVLAGDDATAAAVSELAGRVDVLHVAAHGRHSAENPLFSGLELVDGTWFGYDIDQLPAVPDVVLLSACEVGRSSVRWGEELIGMTAAWLHAGARCVVASPAAVNDVAAHDALVRVHEALASGADPATALAGTVSAVIGGRRPGAVPLLRLTLPNFSRVRGIRRFGDDSSSADTSSAGIPRRRFMSMSHDQPGPRRFADDRFAVISQPRPGTIVEVPPGSQLAVKFRRGLGPSRWHMVGVPGHLLALLVGRRPRVPVPGLRLPRRHGPAAVRAAPPRARDGARGLRAAGGAGQRRRWTNIQARIATNRMTVTARFATVSTATSTPWWLLPAACTTQSAPLVTASPMPKTSSPCAW